jgi:hypothetical protein
MPIMAESAQRRQSPDVVIAHRVFLGIGVALALIAGIYWFTAYEEAGTTMLALSSALALWYGAYLWLRYQHLRSTVPAARTPEGEVEPEEPDYVPHASVWPFVIGLGAAVVVNGLVLGIWVLAPGAALTVIGTGGYIRQSRQRD